MIDTKLTPYATLLLRVSLGILALAHGFSVLNTKGAREAPLFTLLDWTLGCVPDG